MGKNQKVKYNCTVCQVECEGCKGTLFCKPCLRKLRTKQFKWEDLLKFNYKNCPDCGTRFLPNPTFQDYCKPCDVFHKYGNYPRRTNFLPFGDYVE